MPLIVSLAKAADILEIDRNTLLKWLRNGCPTEEVGDREAGIEWKIRVGAVFEWRLRQKMKSARAPDETSESEGSGDPTKVGKDEADRRISAARAIREELETAEALGSMVPLVEVETDVGEFTVRLRDGLASAKGKIAGRAASMTDPAEIERLVETEINKAFDTAVEILNAGGWSAADDDDDDAGDAGAGDARPP